MGTTDSLNAEIEGIIKNLKERLATEFGEPSYDELLKLAAVKDLYNMTLKGKYTYIRLCQELQLLPSEVYISYMLTLIKLISVNGQETVAKNLMSIVDADNGFVDGKMEQILYSYNKVLANEYEKYNPLLLDLKFLNHVANADRVNSGSSPQEKQRRKHLKIDYAIDKYRECYGNDNESLINEIIDDIDNHLELKKGKTY